MHFLSQQVSEIWDKYLNNHHQVLSQARIQQIDLLGKEFETDTGLGKWQFSVGSRAATSSQSTGLVPKRGRAAEPVVEHMPLPRLDYGETETGEQRDFTRIQMPSITHSLSGDILGGKTTLLEPTVISAVHPFLMCHPSRVHKPRQTERRSRITQLSWCLILFLHWTASFFVAARGLVHLTTPRLRKGCVSRSPVQYRSL